MNEQQIAKEILITVISVSSVAAIVATVKWAEYKKLYQECYNNNKYLLKRLKAQREGGKRVMDVIYQVGGKPMKVNVPAFSISREQVNTLMSAADKILDPDWYTRKYK